MALRPYSVSPRWNEKIVGPKPTKYWVTFIPYRLAVIMWPSSCRLTEIKIASAKAAVPNQYSIRLLQPQ
jgi:hypothetical protein